MDRFWVFPFFRLHYVYYRFDDLTHLIDILSILRTVFQFIFVIFFLAEIEYGMPVESNAWDQCPVLIDVSIFS